MHPLQLCFLLSLIIHHQIHKSLQIDLCFFLSTVDCSPFTSLYALEKERKPKMSGAKVTRRRVFPCEEEEVSGGKVIRRRIFPCEEEEEKQKKMDLKSLLFLGQEVKMEKPWNLSDFQEYLTCKLEANHATFKLLQYCEENSKTTKNFETRDN
jgi:hypothetical protein